MEDNTDMVQINVKLSPEDKQKLDIFIAMAVPKTNITKVIREAVKDKVKKVVIPEQRS